MSSAYDKLYAEGGFGYDANIESWRGWVARHYVGAFELRTGDEVLDVGCGDGFWAALLAEQGMRVSGVDRSAMGIEVARRRLPEARFELADIQDSLPFEDGAFDIAFARGLSHLGSPELSTDANRRALENVMRLVRPGGILLTSTYTTRTGAPSETSAWMNHTSSSIVALLAEVGEPVRLDLVGNYLQVAAGHRGAPWPRPAV